MNASKVKLSELKLLRHNDGIKYYRWMCSLRDGNLLLENTINKREVVGKILSAPSEGEVNIWPQLEHENINRLLEVLCISDQVKILISPFIGKSIGTLIYHDSLNKHPLCFDRKKSYCSGILSALSYMHQHSVFHLNLNDENIAICSYTDRAILCDFSYAVAQENVTKRSLPPNRHYQSPEVQNGEDNETFHSSPIDIWDCGVLILQVFTQHHLPWRGAVKDSLEFLDIEILEKTNSGVHHHGAASEFRVFIGHLLSENPHLRPSAEEVLQLRFLQTVYNRLDETAKRFWNNDIISDSFIENDSFIDREVSSNLNASLTDVGYSKSDKARLIWTKSEPDKFNREDLNPVLQGYVSFPSISRKTGEKSVDPSKKIHRSNSLTRWEADNTSLQDDDFSYFPHPQSLLNQEDVHFKYPSCNLEEMIPHIISMTGLNMDVHSTISYNSPSAMLTESDRYNQSDISKVGMSEWVDIPLRNKHKALLKMNSNESVAKKEMVSKEDRSDLPSIKSDSPKLVEKRDLYDKPVTVAIEDGLFYLEETKSPRRKKWYHRLCPGLEMK